MRSFHTLFVLLRMLSVVSVFVAGIIFLFYRQQYAAYAPMVAYQEEVAEEAEQVYTIFLAGDVMLDRGVALRVAEYGADDWRFPWEFVADRLRAYDVVFVNHEGVMSDVGRDAGGVYSFNFPLSALDGLLFAGVDVVSLANNHSFDWGGAALCDTRRRLLERGIGVVGAGCSYDEANAPYLQVFDDGTSVGFLGYTSFLYPEGVATDTHPGISEYSLENMRAAIAALREKVAVVVVSVHWGGEYQAMSNARQRDTGRAFIDAGADIVVGHHPHTIQEVEEYNGGWILYSLGNFIFDQYFSKETMEGLTAVAVVRGGEVVSVTTEKVILNEYFQPVFESDSR